MSIKFPYCMLLVGLLLTLATLSAEPLTTSITPINNVDNNDVLAEYDGGQILRSDLDNKINTLPDNIRSRYKTVDGQLQILEMMAVEDVFFAKAKQLGVENDSLVQAKITGSQKQFYLQEYYTRNVVDKVELTEQKKQDYYEKNKSAFYINPYVTIQYIQAENEAKALQAYNELIDKVPFDSVSAHFSINNYAKGLNGKIKNIRLNGYLPGIGNDSVLEDIIAKAPADEDKIYGPINTSTGWHVFKVVEHVDGKQKTYLDVETEIDGRLRPALETEKLNELVDSLKIKYAVTTDSLLLARINLQDLGSNTSIENSLCFSSPNPAFNITVKDILKRYAAMSQQEQAFYSKDNGAAQLASQELTRELMYRDAVAQNYNQYFIDKPEYKQMTRLHILQNVYKKLVIDSIVVTPEDLAKKYNEQISVFTTPVNRKIQALWIKDADTANLAHSLYLTALANNNNAAIDSLINQYSTNPKKAILDNQYQNGVVTGIGPDKIFSEKIWATPVGETSDVFANDKGEYVFFRVLSENPAYTKPLSEVESRLVSTIKKDKERTRMDEVKNELFNEFHLRKYENKVQIKLNADELFGLADDASRQRKFNDALNFYNQIIANFKNGSDDYKASFMKAFCVTEDMKNPDLGLTLFKQLLVDFPQGEMNDSARFMIDLLEGKIKLEDEDSETTEPDTEEVAPQQ